MTSDAARQSSQPAPIKVPDQLQQTRLPRASGPSGAASPGEPKREAGEAAPREGVLGQLQTERAHD